jgi:hypothetical protein
MARPATISESAIGLFVWCGGTGDNATLQKFIGHSMHFGHLVYAKSI